MSMLQAATSKRAIISPQLSCLIHDQFMPNRSLQHAAASTRLKWKDCYRARIVGASLQGQEEYSVTKPQILPELGHNAAKAVASDQFINNEVEWKGVVLLEKKNFLDLSNKVVDFQDKLSELLGSRVNLQLVSVKTDPETGEGMRSDKAYLENWFQTPGTWRADNGTQYSVNFKVHKEFGVPGAVLVENYHPNPFLLREITLELKNPSNSDSPVTTIKFPCDSWVYSPTLSKGPRIFFSDQCYLPKQTPPGLLKLRMLELENFRGDGTGQRVESDRVYDYAVYNDLGNPDKGAQYTRPVLGGSSDFPYPRRCRTGRPPTRTDPTAESPLNVTGTVYVPRDEEFNRIKESDFLGSTLKSVLHVIVPLIRALLNLSSDFKSFQQVDGLYSRTSLASLRESRQKRNTPEPQHVDHEDGRPLELIRQSTDPRGGDTKFFTFPVPQIIQVNEKVWCADSEFARQMLVGVNPVVIERLKVFPPTSSLDPKIYGPALSAITAQHVEANLEGMTVEEALREKRLYTLDYHDVYMPYLERINKLNGKGYGTRTLLFLARNGTLSPIAIELSLPPSDGKPSNSRVFVPPSPGKDDPLWELAKLHVVLNDTGYHELVSHWLRSHACMEPIIIATRRQLSAMHPINCLLMPHFKNTMNINAAARNLLINSFSGSLIDGGIIEYGFTPGRYSMELSSAAYKLQWRFDEQALPADLIKRGVAEADPTAKHGVRLLIEDYPFAVDALDIWAALSGWAEDYVDIFYSDDAEVAADEELQAWWWEIRYKGHGDKADEGWWPELTGKAELVSVATTLMWVASAHHAAVNFGQFGYGGFPPSRATMGRRLVPEEGSPEYRELTKDPTAFYFQTMSKVPQSLIVIATLEILSTHAINEEYLGHSTPANGPATAAVQEALKRFRQRLNDADNEIHKRNSDHSLRNRYGDACILYTILRPFSRSPGLSGRGIPNSVSI